MSSLLAGFGLGLVHFGALRWSVRRLLLRPQAFAGSYLLRLTVTLLGLAWLSRAGGSLWLAFLGILVARQVSLWRGASWN